MAKGLRCPNCGGTFPDTEFDGTQRVESYRHVQVTGVADDGLEFEGVDHTYGDAVGPLRLTCGDCGHEWPTTRPMAWFPEAVT